MAFRVACPYCHGDQTHVVESEFWNVIEEQLLHCLDRADPEARGQLGYVQEGPVIGEKVVEAGV